MKASSRLLYPIVIAIFLAACSPRAVKTVPVVYITATPPVKVAATPSPSDTASWTPVPHTLTPSPSATILQTTPSPTHEYAPQPVLICDPVEFDAYLLEWDPLITKLILMAREVGKIEELPRSRAEEILTETTEIDGLIKEIIVPPCLEYAHQKTISATILLIDSTNLFLAEDFDLAIDTLVECFEEIARAAVYSGLMLAEMTQTSTPEQ